MSSLQPKASASHGGVDRAHEHDSEHGIECARGQLLGASQEVSRSVVDQDVERAVFPNGLDHLFEARQIANVASVRSNLVWRYAAQLGFRFGQNLLAASADMNGGAEL